MNKNLLILSLIAIISTIIVLINSNQDTLSILFGVIAVISMISINFINNKKEEKETFIEEKEIDNYDEEILDEILEVSYQSSIGEYDLRVKGTSSNEKLQKIATNINTTLNQFRETIDSIKNFMEKYNSNDFTIQIENKYNNDLKELIDEINQVNIKISKMLLSSLKNNTKLNANSDSLKANMDSLGNSVIQQSATLEETAAAIEEITSTVINNNKNVHDMLTYSDELSSSIEKGFSNAKENASLMDKINEKTNAIEEAIVVIDQIAFQTNILSLNAAVEAATAGEAGKGFAVVAQEVRNLASRSAEAASEIKKLVNDASEVTKQGKTASNDMINEYTSINDNIDKTKVIINEVSNSLKEQERGIEQINSAVAQLDKSTQENATRAQNTLEVANINHEMAKRMVVDTNKTNFFGRDEFNSKS
jgi:methyl-accepting chemotaxis protein